MSQERPKKRQDEPKMAQEKPKRPYLENRPPWPLPATCRSPTENLPARVVKTPSGPKTSAPPRRNADSRKAAVGTPLVRVSLRDTLAFSNLLAEGYLKRQSCLPAAGRGRIYSLHDTGRAL